MKRTTSEITDEWLVLRTRSGDADALRILRELKRLELQLARLGAASGDGDRGVR